ncbi:MULTISPECIES: DUF2147 domain-containing protein [Sphingobium]|jgi:uncharacterized protein (DUF2147 family)|uniref:DUF2147 domain-containing protein n=2 Tax=Sphingobium TaxID=165695 RepID=A0A418YLS6_9SPHN|nr:MULTISPECIES: DUF2147 domain-containing protein [Sphingobium]MBS90453.1 DUF2147 domain-containing protein [Sphingobium sp.]MDG2516091.1 DUF2147 domain-containing protein [Sphingobium yanoikuyae]OAN54561.1 hypothetical protein A7Q26_03650 [Sphingobium sp. TCM1]RJG52060.1 DUF2147 domain-containing protein [Sphingobium terrigena]RSU55428.1 DUF2147 domain-containing protein [Sphingobium yanoikuyae]
MRFSFVLAAMLLLATSASVEAQRASFGVWKNPQDSVHVRAQPCGSRMCGVVVWASDKAKADARRGGTNDLVGLILFRDFVPEKKGVWRGSVFVPDIGQTFSGTITTLDDRRMEGKGCLTGRIMCKSQIWTKVN